MSERQEKKITSSMKTTWYPDVPWNVMKPGTEKDKEGSPIPVTIPDSERVAVEIDWPDLEQFEVEIAGKPSSNAIYITLAKKHTSKITGFTCHGVTPEDGVELAAIGGPKSKRARELLINIGSYIFLEEGLTEEEEKK